jgi:hypothetical protein
VKLEIINPLQHPNWNELLSTSNDASFFHSINWAQTIYNTYQYKPLYLSLIENNKLQALLPLFEINSKITGKRAVSLPFTDFCDAITSPKCSLENLLNYAIEYGKKEQWDSFEFRGGRIDFENVSPSATFYYHQLELYKDHNKIFSTFRKSTQRNIKKANKLGLEIQINNSKNAVKEYYRLHGITKKRHGIPVQPSQFFENIYENIIAKGFGNVALAYFEGNCIAGAIFFNYGPQAIYNFGASDFKYQHLRPNNFLMWEAIKWYADNGFSSFCYGITDTTNSGLAQFKAGMSTTEETISYYNYNFKTNSYVVDDATITNFRRKIFKNMPISMLKFAGKYLYKHYG